MDSLGATMKKEDNKQIVYDSICHSSSKPKLYFWKELRIQFTCFTSCGNLNIYRLVMRVKNLSFTQALEYICDVCNIPYESTKRLTEKKTTDNWKSSLSKYTRYKSRYSELTTYDKNILNFFEKKYHDSWLEEGITIESMKKYKIRWYSYLNAIIIPCFNESFELIGIRGRFMEPDAYAKYMPISMLDGTMYKFPTNQSFYGIQFTKQAIMRNKKIVLFEGEKSPLLCDTWYGEDNYSTALYGSNIGKFRRDEILKMGVEEVILGFDWDYEEYGDKDYEEYEKKCLKAGELFRGFCKVSVLCSHGGHVKKDSPVDLGKEKYEEYYTNREEIQWD